MGFIILLNIAISFSSDFLNIVDSVFFPIHYSDKNFIKSATGN